MILSERVPWDENEWKEILRRSVRDADTLRTKLDLRPEQTAWLDHSNFSVFVPLPYLSRIEPGNPADPLLLQVAPSVLEQQEVDGYSTDPLGERNSAASRVLQKYSGRLLYIAASACPIHCRYCFRRHFPYDDHESASVESLLAALSKDKSIFEVILSGGDPLLLSDCSLKKLVSEISAVPHVRTIRIHTRFAVVLPQRVTTQLLEALRDERLNIVVVIHANHPNELDMNVELAIKAFKSTDVTLLNQSVLLKGVNDSATVLKQLSWKLFRIGVLPYYLHLLDKVTGTSHFDLPEEQALSIFRTLQSSVPGYLAPRLVREIPGRGSKTLVNAGTVS
ncbi:MAG: EF-P beta-lysylation protein EpmB [Gammaproteobacteria bacterium]|nr:EF-P beta-lysylation protein EpmB [Gammaproteobacteria bacterium]